MQRNLFILTTITLTIATVFPINTVEAQIPGKAQIAFISSRPWEGDGFPQVYTMDADGGNLRRLTNGPGFRTTPKWSPDGKHIAFAMYIPDKDSAGFHDIYIIDADGGSLQRLTDEESPARWPTWSPDSREIAFFVYDGTGINIVDIRGANRKQITKILAVYSFLAWSPDGRKIAFSSQGVFDKANESDNIAFHKSF